MLTFTDGVHTTTNPKRHGTHYTIHRKDGTVIQTRSYAVSPIE